MEGAHIAPPEEYREYLLASAFGYTPNEIDEQPATRLDWLVAMHVAVKQVEADQQNRGA